MRVELIAHTVVTGWGVMRDAGWVDYELGDGDYGEDVAGIDADYLAEFAGRGCYQSWERPNPATATNVGYLRHILEVEHTSVLEHASATFYVEGVSRSLLMELRTHRHLSFSALSQRYVDEAKAQMICPPAFTEAQHRSALNSVADHAQQMYTLLSDDLYASGFSRKQAREAARAVLPNATETRFVVSGNMWAWRYVLTKRKAAGADAEIQLVAKEMWRQLTEIAPNTFQDM